VRLRAVQERREDVPEGRGVVFGHQVGRRHATSSSPVYPRRTVAPWFAYTIREVVGSKKMTAPGTSLPYAWRCPSRYGIASHRLGEGFRTRNRLTVRPTGPRTRASAD
jgi:hypothetical protein